MHKRGARLALVALLLAIGGAAAVLSLDVDRKLQALSIAERDRAQRIDAMMAALADIALAQHGYVALGSVPTPSAALVASLLRQFETDATALRRTTTSPDAARILEAVGEEMAQVTAIDARTRDYARQGQTFLASDLLFGSAREHLSAAGAHLRKLRTTEAFAVANQRAVLRQELWSALGTGAALWAAGFVLLAWRREPRAGAPIAASVPQAERSATVPEATAAADTRPAAQPSTARSLVDLAATAALCNDLSRLTATAQLPELLARAAGILNARGLIVWMGAGEQLFAAAAHGYEPRIVSRLAPISRNAGNATAAAWRTGRLGTVGAEAGSNGAIVAPMFNPSHCVGVLAAEVREDREKDATTRAVTAIIAAQLGAVLAAWPAASSNESETSSRDRAAG
jgi:hypothetical protein